MARSLQNKMTGFNPGDDAHTAYRNGLTAAANAIKAAAPKLKAALPDIWAMEVAICWARKIAPFAIFFIIAPP